MLDYFRNFSSSAHQVCCEDSLTNWWPWPSCSLIVIVLISLTIFKLPLWQYLSCLAFKLDMTVELCTYNNYAQAHCDDLDLDFENVCKPHPACCFICMLHYVLMYVQEVNKIHNGWSIYFLWIGYQFHFMCYQALRWPCAVGRPITLCINL